MRKKILIIIGTIIVVLVVALLLFRKESSNSGSNATGNTGATGTLPPIAIGSSTFTPPSGSTLTIGTSQGNVVVNNFYNSTQQISVDHTSVLIAQTNDYNITYYAPDNSFNILISTTPFDTVRQQAETAFLQILGISQADACKLKVQVGTPESVDPAHAGQNLGLSFCTAGAF